MPERGKCQACGRFAALERVYLSVRGCVVFDRELCRVCACAVEDAATAIARVARQYGPVKLR